MKKLLTTLAIALVGLSGTSAQATNLVTNGNFEQTTNGNGQLGFNTTVTGWTSNGYNFVYAPGTADTSGAVGVDGNVKLWGPGNGSANGLTTSPDGGNFLAADGAYEVGAIKQTINGLVAGQQYNVSFDWAGAQQSGFTGVTTEQWAVSLGNETLSTQILTDANHGFTGWLSDTLTFTATGSSEVLSFLANGTPNGEPPFSLLDGVSMTATVPEPGTIWEMMIGAVGLIAFALLRRRHANKA